MINNIKFPDLKISHKFLYFSIIFSLIILSAYLFFIDQTKFVIIPLIPFVGLLFFFTFRRYFLYYFIFSLGVVRYLQFDYRIQIITIISIMILILFATYKDTETFNNLKYPYSIKLLSVLIVIQVLISSIISKYVSFQSVVYGCVFTIFVLISYVIFRSVKNIKHINKLIDLFILLVVVSTLLTFADIFVTGYTRSSGLIGYAIMDFCVLVLLFLIFRNYLFGKANVLTHISALLVFLLTILHQSRFAWLGFVLSLVYGIIVAVKYSPSVKVYLKKRVLSYFLLGVVFIGLVFIFGFHELILLRVSQISLDFFQGTPEEGQYLSNSLESRLLIWLTAYNVFIAHPFWGVGFYMFPLVSEQYNFLPQIMYELYVENMDAHTTYFNFLVDTGIIGFTLFLSYFIAMFRLSFKALKISLTDEEKSISIVLNVYCFFVIVHSIYSGAFTFGLNAFHMWFMFALNLSNYIILKNNYEEYPV